MKIINLFCIAFVGCLTMLSCEQEDLAIESNKSLENEITDVSSKNTINYYDQQKGENIVFQSADEVVKYFEGTEYSAIVSAKMKVLVQERSYIEEHKLYDLPEDHELVVNYLKRFASENGSSPAVENAIGGRLYDGSFSTGAKLSSTSTPVPSMRRSYRNRASSVKGGIQGGSVLLFDRTWYRGSSEFMLIAPFINSNINNLNNRSESFL